MPILTKKRKNLLDEEYLVKALEASSNYNPEVAQGYNPEALLYQRFQELGLRKLLEDMGKNADIRWGY